jgi:hypothetical protein
MGRSGRRATRTFGAPAGTRRISTATTGPDYTKAIEALFAAYNELSAGMFEALKG